MAKITIDVGTAADDGTGDPLRTAFVAVNTNFTEVYTAGPVGSNVRITNNSIITTNTNGNLVLAPNGVGKVTANVDIVPNTANVRNLGSSTLLWDTVYSRTASVAGNITGGNVITTGLVSAATLKVNQISSDDSSFVRVEDGLDVNGDIDAEAITVTEYFGLPIYANVTVRDSTITTPSTGMMIYITGTGMQVRGATAWNTVAGTGT